MKKNNKKQDLLIIGGGIMGLFTAYYASAFVKDITILEKSTIGNKEAASFSFTRSIRNDYLDPFYSQLAYEAQLLWREIQVKTAEQFLVTCGCLNIVKKTVTADINQTYAQKSYENMKRINLNTKKFTKTSLAKAFPQFEADFAMIDSEAGFLYVPIITNVLITALKERGVCIKENSAITSVQETEDVVGVTTTTQIYQARKVIITAGLGTNTILKQTKNNSLTLPLTPDRPQECRYFFIPDEKRELFMPNNFPVFAYLDVGIYGHPIFDARNCIKIGYYNPPDIRKKVKPEITCIAEFIATCMPLLQGVRNELVTDADQCSYDLVADDNFIIGNLPTYRNIIIGTGWRGTGYKFAPLIGKILMQLSLQGKTIYDIKRFSPERFNTYDK